MTTTTNYTRANPNNYATQRAMRVRDRAYWLLTDRGVDALGASHDVWAAACAEARGEIAAEDGAK